MKKHIISILITCCILTAGTIKTFALNEYLPGQTYTDTWFYFWSVCPSPSGPAELDVFTDLPSGATFSPGSFTIPATPGYFYPFTVTFTTPATPGTYFYEIIDLIDGSSFVKDVIVTSTPPPNLIHTFTVPVGQAKDTSFTLTNTPSTLSNGCSVGSETYTYNVTTYPASPKLTVLNPVFSIAPNNSANYTYHLLSQTPDTLSFVRQLTTDGGHPSFRRVDIIFTCVAPNASVTAGGPTSICPGSSVLLNAVAAANRTYQWKKNNVNIPGATQTSYTATDSGTYKVKVTNTISGCSKTSTGTKVTLKALPSASVTAGSSTTFCDGGSVTLSTGTGANKTYQWKKGGNNIAGATGSSYIATVGGSYKVTVTNTTTGCSSTTSPGKTVTVNPVPVAHITPTGTISFCAGQSAVLKATNQFGYSFQWKKNNVNIPGATADSLVVTTAGIYRVLVQNLFGCLNTSNRDTVVVPCREEMSNNVAGTEGLMLYPNPASDHLEFRMISATEKSTLGIFNLMGSEIMNKAISSNGDGNYFESLDISILPPGIYLLKVTNETGQHSKRFVKE